MFVKLKQTLRVYFKSDSFVTKPHFLFSCSIKFNIINLPSETHCAYKSWFQTGLKKKKESQWGAAGECDRDVLWPGCGMLPRFVHDSLPAGGCLSPEAEWLHKDRLRLPLAMDTRTINHEHDWCTDESCFRKLTNGYCFWCVRLNFLSIAKTDISFGDMSLCNDIAKPLTLLKLC